MTFGRATLTDDELRDLEDTVYAQTGGRISDLGSVHSETHALDYVQDGTRELVERSVGLPQESRRKDDHLER